MDDYIEYFDSIMSRSWLGQTRTRTGTSIEKSNIEDIYLDIIDSDKIILIGKTEKFYFILECIDSENYKYSNGLFNDNLVDLIAGYKNRDSFTFGHDVKNFVDSLLLKSKLTKELQINNSTVTKIKSRKI